MHLSVRGGVISPRGAPHPPEDFVGLAEVGLRVVLQESASPHNAVQSGSDSTITNGHLAWEGVGMVPLERLGEKELEVFHQT